MWVEIDGIKGFISLVSDFVWGFANFDFFESPRKKFLDPKCKLIIFCNFENLFLDFHYENIVNPIFEDFSAVFLNSSRFCHTCRHFEDLVAQEIPQKFNIDSISFDETDKVSIQNLTTSIWHNKVDLAWKI